MNLLEDVRSFECRVSSVLNRNAKEFGKKHLFDGQADTCYNSDQGTPQWISINFGSAERSASEVRIQFQGGFAGKNCWVEVSKSGSAEDLVERQAFFPEDTNKLQSFALVPPVTGKLFKFVFGESTDLFGRITIYRFELY